MVIENSKKARKCPGLFVLPARSLYESATLLAPPRTGNSAVENALAAPMSTGLRRAHTHALIRHQ